MTRKTTVLPYILTEQMFDVSAKTFCEYAKRKNIIFNKGDGGIYLKFKSELKSEEFEIISDEKSVVIYACTSKGMHNALAYLLSKLEIKNEKIYLSCSYIRENPDMPYRGLCVDLARQKHPCEYILEYIDLCYFNRATHLQLHFTDDESFTLPVSSFPELSTQGRTYTREEIDKICSYAKSRGIVLIPEVDIPGHTAQFCKKYPELFGVLNVLPADEKVFDAVRLIFGEVAEMFPDSPLIHIGGDEAAINKWVDCKTTQAYMDKNGIKNIHEMYAEYIRIVSEMVLQLGRTPVVWEGFSKEYNDRISKDVIVICWESLYQPAYDLAASGFTIINASWKPLYVVTYFKYWSPEEISNWNPWNWQNWLEASAAYPDGYTIDKNSSNVIGAQLCVWGDKLKNLEDWEAGIKDEFVLVKERFPALCNKLFDLNYKIV